jgi:hypothetical protein
VAADQFLERRFVAALKAADQQNVVLASAESWSAVESGGVDCRH